MYMNKLW